MKDRIQKKKAERPIEDLTGQTFGRLQVLYRCENKQATRAEWACCCTCAKPLKNPVYVKGSHLKAGDVGSCGCLKAEYRIKARGKERSTFRSIVLTQEQVAEIRQAHAQLDHPTRAETATKYGISKKTVSDVTTCKTWSDSRIGRNKMRLSNGIDFRLK